MKVHPQGAKAPKSKASASLTVTYKTVMPIEDIIEWVDNCRDIDAGHDNTREVEETVIDSTESLVAALTLVSDSAYGIINDLSIWDSEPSNFELDAEYVAEDEK